MVRKRYIYRISMDGAKINKRTHNANKRCLGTLQGGQ
uniref:Uncharacterized protein n=1 Tax=Arundo donax TaxID=35708 RepID=A0A0A9GNX2_ARUDO